MIDLFSPGLRNAPSLNLSDGKVWLRPPEAGDWREWAELRAQSRDFLQPWEPTWPPDSLTKASYLRRVRRQYEEWQNDFGYAMLIFALPEQKLVGGISLSQVRRGIAQMATLGYWIGEPYARKGYMSAAIPLLLKHAFENLSLHRIEAGCVPTNAPSISLLRKLGFTEEGRARQYLRINGKWEDHVLFAMLREDKVQR